MEHWHIRVARMLGITPAEFVKWGDVGRYQGLEFYIDKPQGETEDYLHITRRGKNQALTYFIKYSIKNVSFGRYLTRVIDQLSKTSVS